MGRRETGAPHRKQGGAPQKMKGRTRLQIRLDEIRNHGKVTIWLLEDRDMAAGSKLHPSHLGNALEEGQLCLVLRLIIYTVYDQSGRENAMRFWRYGPGSQGACDVEFIRSQPKCELRVSQRQVELKNETHICITTV